mmetsp:Transcript_38711/g.84496  ORF Transcript_38711/g.84496 Transcript_38711/m.84496 type:complete len:261 (-) Transcript_38711:1255-2037(-)
MGVFHCGSEERKGNTKSQLAANSVHLHHAGLQGLVLRSKLPGIQLKLLGHVLRQAGGHHLRLHTLRLHLADQPFHQLRGTVHLVRLLPDCSLIVFRLQFSDLPTEGLPLLLHLGLQLFLLFGKFGFTIFKLFHELCFVFSNCRLCVQALLLRKLLHSIFPIHHHRLAIGIHLNLLFLATLCGINVAEDVVVAKNEAVAMIQVGLLLERLTIDPDNSIRMGRLKITSASLLVEFNPYMFIKNRLARQANSDTFLLFVCVAD